MDLAGCSALFRLLADPTRVRLLALLEHDELTVAELAAVTRLAQPRVSTHLAKLKEAGVVHDRRAGVSAYYRLNTEGDATLAALWLTLKAQTEDAVLREDAKRLPGVLAKRAREENWADAVAGDMERHYSPGRTWEAVGRGIANLLTLGDVLDVASGDGVLAELLAPHARSIHCVDSSARVIGAARERLKPLTNVVVALGDMHDLRFDDESFDVVLLMHALTYSDKPASALAEAARVLRPGGKVLATTLVRHAHKRAVEPFDHRNLGFTVEELGKLARKAGIAVLRCAPSSRERRPPHFEVLTLFGVKR